MDREPDEPVAKRSNRSFQTTQWSLILEAREALSPDSRKALEILCQAYWLPVYSFIRRRGHDPVAAEDLTQGFFCRLLEKNSLQAADQNRGRFRSFLLSSVKYYLADQRDRENAQKRGGVLPHVALDFSNGESRYLEPGQDVTPEALFERQWIYTLLDDVMDEMRREAASQGRGEDFELLRGHLTGSSDASQTSGAEQLGISPGAFRVRVHRLRARFGQSLRTRIAATVEDPGEVENEIRYLLRILAG